MTLPKDPIKAAEYKLRMSTKYTGAGHPQYGTKHTPEHCKKIRDSHIGITRPHMLLPKSEETRKRMGDAHRGKVVSEAMREKLRIANIGKTCPDHVKKKLSELFTGRVVSEETRKKLSVAAKGRKHSAEACAKISASKKNISPETRERMRLGQLRRAPISEATREKHRARSRGENNPNWRGGITNLRRLMRASDKMREWRTAVFERDGYKDYKTRMGGSIEAHHRIPLSVLLKKYDIRTIEEALGCDELWDISNGVTMTKQAHKDYHDLWGRRANDFE